MVREGVIRQAGGAEGPTGVVVSPSDRQVTLGGGGAPSIEMDEQGFYSVRLPGMGNRRPYVVAVNMDAAESDLTALSPADFLAGATGGAAVRPADALSLDEVEVTPADLEKRQSLWWFLLAGGLAALLAESVLSNRLSRAQSAQRPEPA
jgi:hypothetical protein